MIVLFLKLLVPCGERKMKNFLPNDVFIKGEFDSIRYYLYRKIISDKVQIWVAVWGYHGLIAESNEEFMDLSFREIESRIYSIWSLNAR